MNRRSFLTSTSALAAGLTTLPIMRTVRAADSEDPDEAAVLDEARANITRYRQGDCAVIVRDTEGRPLPDVPVTIQQQQHDFRFGCNLFRLNRIADTRREDLYRARFAELFNFATTGFYWASYERSPGEPEYAYTDALLDWTESAGIEVKGHPLAWDHPAGNPRWLPEDPAEVGRLSRERTHACVRRFQRRIRMWDVVNEAVHLGEANTQMRMSAYAQTRGALPYIREHLAAARLANPAATLLVNDYRLEQRYFELLDELRDVSGKLLFDAVGLQSHMHGGPWPLHRLRRLATTYAPLGLPLHFTEITVVSGPRATGARRWNETTPELEVKQADAVERLYTVLFGQPSVTAATWWDFSDDGAWQRAAAGFLRKDMTPKPAYERLEQLIKHDWWSRKTGKTNAEGTFGARVTFGQHRIHVASPSGPAVERIVHLRPGRPSRVEVTA